MNSTNTTNLLYGCKGEVKQTIRRPESILMGIFMIIMIAVSVFGNSLVILAVYKFERLRTTTNALLCSLAVGDLLSPIFRVTSIAVSSLAGRWVFGCVWCVINSQIGIFFCAASIVHLCVITVERYVAIRCPYKHDEWITKKKLTIMITATWIVSVIMALLPMIFKSQITLSFNINIPSCEIDLARNPYLSLLLLAIYFAIPLFIIIILYSHIFYIVHVTNKKISENSIGNRSVKHRLMMKKEFKAIKTVVVIVGLFAILWVPFFVYTVIRSYRSNISSWVGRFALCCAYLNSCCDWVVYSVKNKNMRSSFFQLLKVKRKRSIYTHNETTMSRQYSSSNSSVYLRGTGTVRADNSPTVGRKVENTLKVESCRDNYHYNAKNGGMVSLGIDNPIIVIEGPTSKALTVPTPNEHYNEYIDTVGTAGIKCDSQSDDKIEGQDNLRDLGDGLVSQN